MLVSISNEYIDLCMFFKYIVLVFYTFTDRVCQQQGLSLWVPFQNAATAVTNLYKGKFMGSHAFVFPLRSTESILSPDLYYR